MHGTPRVLINRSNTGTAKSLIRTKVTTAAKGKVGQDPDGLLLMLHRGLDQILDGEDADDLAFVVQQGEVADVLREHLLHAAVDGVVRGGRDEVGGLGGDLLNFGFLGIAAEEGHLVHVVPLRDDARDETCIMEIREIYNGYVQR